MTGEAWTPDEWRDAREYLLCEMPYLDPDDVHRARKTIDSMTNTIAEQHTALTEAREAMDQMDRALYEIGVWAMKPTGVRLDVASGYLNRIATIAQASLAAREEGGEK